MLTGLAAIYKDGKRHNDVKPQNILVLPGNNAEGQRFVLADASVPFVLDTDITKIIYNVGKTKT